MIQMSKENKIEQMKKEIKTALTYDCSKARCLSCKHINEENCEPSIIADHLINIGYNRAEWISVKDRLPKHEERCLIFTKIHFVPDHVDECNYYEGVEISAFYKDFGFLSNNGMYATHWMTLPEPPETKGETE